MLLHINYTSQAVSSSACVQESCAVLKLNPLVSIENAGVYRNGKWLVRGVGFSIAPAEIVTLIGPNGSGKSTTAKAILGICDLDEGKRTQNNDLRIGYVPQKIEIDWTLPLTVERFMSITARLSSSAIDENLKRTSVHHLKKSQLRSLSGGELQRVLLARAIARKPELLVLDEPVQGVDFAGEISLYDLISEIRDELQCGILMISHDLHVVMAATDRVICLNGHVCCQGTPDAVAESLEYKHLFGERAVGSLAVYQHQHDHQHLADGTVLHADGSITEHCHPDDGHHHGEHNHGEDKEDQPNV